MTSYNRIRKHIDMRKFIVTLTLLFIRQVTLETDTSFKHIGINMIKEHVLRT